MFLSLVSAALILLRCLLGLVHPGYVIFFFRENGMLLYHFIDEIDAVGRHGELAWAGVMMSGNRP